jgi:hypothetical protein
VRVTNKPSNILSTPRRYAALEKTVIFLIFLVLTAVIILPLAGCGNLAGIFQNPNYTYEDGAVLVRGNDQPIQLVNNQQAVDVSYAELLDFIRSDPSDKHLYIARGSTTPEKSFVCSDFAEIVHNNAEASGIRAAYMGIDWMDGSIGHAINAFETTDQGMVYIDCTGQSIYSQIETGQNAPQSDSWDKVAYIEVGKKYGVIGLDYARSPDYPFFAEYDRKWQEFRDKLAVYNAEVKQFNQTIANRTFREGSAELEQVKNWESQLNDKEVELHALSDDIGDSRFKPLGIVKSTFLHW